MTALGFASRSDVYADGVWLAGDHHIHTRYSIDGQYQVAEQVANAARLGRIGLYRDPI
jgi:hypothetical protein